MRRNKAVNSKKFDRFAELEKIIFLTSNMNSNKTVRVHERNLKIKKLSQRNIFCLAV